MIQRFYHYTMWEDFKNRMYDEVKDGRADRIKKAIKLLTDTKTLYAQMTRVTNEWKYATEQNLTNASINHQAFLGQTACNIWQGIKEDETREAWGHLTCEQRYRANKVADQVYKEWRQRYEKQNGECYQLTLSDMEVNA